MSRPDKSEWFSYVTAERGSDRLAALGAYTDSQMVDELRRTSGDRVLLDLPGLFVRTGVYDYSIQLYIHKSLIEGRK